MPSHQVATRASTDILAIADAVVTQALRFIKNHACDPIVVQDVVDQVPVCRTLLEKRFQLATGRTVHREIMRVKLEEAKRLMAGTGRTLDDIAEAAGFQSAVYLSQVFRRELGTTPASWRSERRHARIA